MLKFPIFYLLKRGEHCEGRNSPEIYPGKGLLRLWGDISDWFHQEGTARGNLLQVPPLLYRITANDRHRRQGRKIPEKIRSDEVGANSRAVLCYFCSCSENRIGLSATVVPRRGMGVASKNRPLLPKLSERKKVSFRNQVV